MHRNGNNSLQAFWVLIGSFSFFAFALLSAAILSRLLNKAEYGTYKQILFIYNTCLVVFAAGLPKIYSYFLPRHSIPQGKEIVARITKMLYLLGFSFSLFVYCCSGPISVAMKNPELARGLKHFAPIPMLLLLTLGLEGIFSSYKQTFYFAIYNTVSRLIILLSIVLPVLFLKESYLYALYGWVVASIATFLLASYFKGIPFRGVESERAGLTYKKVFAYSLPLVVASFGEIMARAASSFYVSRYFGAEVFADFANGFIELPFAAMVIAATSTVLIPIFSKMIHDQSDVSNLVDVWKRSITKSATIIYPIAIFFIFNAAGTMTLLFSESYINSANYFQIAMLLNFINIVTFAPFFIASGRTRVYSSIHVFFGLLAWFVGYVAAITFKSPIAIAGSWVILAIVRVLVFTKYAGFLIGVRLFSLLPAGKMWGLLTHSLFAMIVTKLITENVFPAATVSGALFVNFLLFGCLILVTAKLFNVDYVEIMVPIIGKLIKEKNPS